MSINMDNGGELSSDYGDVELQVIDVTSDFNGTNADNEGVSKTATFEPAGGLDRDELAELVHMDAFITLSTRDIESDQQTQVGSVRADYRAFINDRDSAEAPSSVDTELINNPTIESPNESQINDAGYLMLMNHVTAPQIKDNTVDASLGAGGKHNPTTTFSRNFRSAFGGGPVLDRFDDINLLVEHKARNLATRTKTEARLFMYYYVDEFENMSNSFGRP